MLKTNSKQAKQNIRDYILQHTYFDGYEEYEHLNEDLDKIFTKTPQGYLYNGYNELLFKNIARALRETVFNEIQKYDNRPSMRNNYNAFEEWIYGLPTALDPTYIYSVSAIDVLGDILEETETERERFTEQQASSKLTYLLYREIYNC